MSDTAAIVGGVAAGAALLGVGYLGWRWYQRRRAVQFLSSPQARQFINTFAADRRDNIGPSYV